MKKFLAVLLACLMLATMVSVPAFATEAETYTLTDLLGDFYSVRETKTDLTASSSKMLWVSPTEGAALGLAGDAVEMTFKVNMELTDDSVDESVGIVIYDGDGQRLYMTVRENRVDVTNNDNYSDIAIFSDADAEKMLNQDVTLLFVNNESNYSIYMKENGTYRHVLSTTGKRSGEGTAVNVGVSNATTVDIASITYYDGKLFGDSYYLRDVIGPYNVTTSVYTSSPADGGYVLGNTGDFAELKFRTNIPIEGGNDQYADFVMAGSDGLRAWLRIHETGAWIKNGNEVEAFSADAVQKIRNVDTTMVILNNGNNFILYVKNSNGEYEKIFTSTGKGTADTGRTNIVINGSVVLDYAKCYESAGLADSAAKAGSCYALVEQNFDNGSVNGEFTLGTSSTISNGVLTIAEGETLSLKEADIPMGGYAEFKFKPSEVFWIKTADGVTTGSDVQICLTPNGTSYCYPYAGNTFVVSYLKNRADEWHVYRIVRSATDINCYSIYHKGESDKAWVLVKETDTQGRAASRNSFDLNSATGAAQVDYVKIYGPVSANGITLTDGAYKTATLADGATLKRDNLRALTNGVSGKLIFAGYDNDDNLLAADLRTIDGAGGEAEEIFDTTVKSGITKVKVFLWDGFTVINPVVSARNIVVD